MVWARRRRPRGRDRAGGRTRPGVTAADPDRDGAPAVGSPEWIAGLRTIPSTSVGAPAFDLAGTGVDGEPVRVAVCHQPAWFLVCFLAPDCAGCRAVWDALTDGPVTIAGRELRPAVVLREDGFRGAHVAGLAAHVTPVPVVGSDAAWSDYGVLGYPELVVVDGTCSLVMARTTVFGWEDAVVRLARELTTTVAAEASDGRSGQARR